VEQNVCPERGSDGEILIGQVHKGIL
jgi:hypothetical protein